MKINKIICYLLAIILSVSVFFVPSFAEENINVQAIELLNELGIVKGYEDGELHPEYNITRMEYAALIIRCLGYEGEYPSLDNVFTDVPKESWGAAAVQFAYDLGIINGYGDGRFGPDDNILEVDAVKIIVGALGRRLEAESSGGYPTGYLSIAQRLKLMKNYKGGEELATRAFVATLIANALEVSIVEQSFTSNSFTKNDGRTILSILGISRYQGVLTAVSGVNIDSRDNVYPDEVVISGRIFKTDKKFSSEFVAEKVTAYIKDYGKSEEKLLAMFTSADENKNLFVKSKDILDSTNLKKFVYIDENKEKEIDLPSGILIVYNGTLLNSSVQVVPERLKPINGSVKLVDTNKDNKYDLAIVKEYKTFVVKSVTEDAIYDIFTNNIEFDADSENSVITVIKDGKILSWEEIKSGNVLSIAANFDKNVAEIVIQDEVLNDKVISRATRNGITYYGLESGNEFKTSFEYRDALSKNYREATKLEIGVKYKLRLNSFGEIAFVEDFVSENDGSADGSDSNNEEIQVKGKELYGFLLDATFDNSGMTEKLKVKLLTTNNRFEYFLISGDNNVRFGRMVDGSYRVGKATPSEIYPVLDSSDGIIQRQIIKYVLDEDGTIKEFYLRDTNAGIGSATLSMDYGRYNNTFAYNNVDQRWYYDENTVVFLLTGNGQSDDNILATTPGGYFTNRVTINSDLWDIDSTGFIGCICLHPATGESVNGQEALFVLDVLNDPVMVVTNVGQEINEDGIPYVIVEGYEGGKKVRTLLSDGLSQIAAIRPGMVIQYGTNKELLRYALYSEYDLVMLGYQEMFDCGDLDKKEFVYYDHKNKFSAGARMNYGYATVTRVDYPTITFSTRDIKVQLHKGTQVLKYNSGSGDLEKADTTQIVEGQKVFFRIRLNNLRDIIIID